MTISPCSRDERFLLARSGGIFSSDLLNTRITTFSFLSL